MNAASNRSVYSAVVYSEDGADHGPIDLTGAENESQARELANVRGIEWMSASVFDHVTIRITKNGYGLSRVEVSR
jgi:hypothetical protein